ncbi:MAG: hypothetical protein ACYC6O_08070 [Thermoleophilia bacterium]
MAKSGGHIMLSRKDRGTVIFLIWKSLPYNTRLLLSFGLISAGLILQFAAGVFFNGESLSKASGISFTAQFMIGAVPILFGSLLLLVRGYDNRVDNAKLDPTATWEIVERTKLAELTELERKIRKWDASALDVTSITGLILFLVVTAALVLLAVFLTGMARIIALDAMLLLLPQWVTGIRRILVLPNLSIRINTLTQVLDGAGNDLEEDKVDIMMLLKGKETRIPDDVKFRVSLKGQKPDFMGLYGQVVINNVQGRSYPYFYVVLVAKKGFGLKAAFDEFQPSPELTREFGVDAEVEFIVLRQATTSTSGYDVKPETAAAIFRLGLVLAGKVARADGGQEQPTGQKPA